MKVFISWSGQRSKLVATSLRQWLPDVIQSVRPWMSEMDLEAGTRWSRGISSELSESNFGIICLTRDNLNAPWILFESGALAKSINDTYVCPYLIDLSPSDLPQGPLTQFQAKRSSKEETWDLVCTINKAMQGSSLPEEQLHRTFNRWWPDLENTINGLPAIEENAKPIRSNESMIQEILELVRILTRHPIEDEEFRNAVIQLINKKERKPLELTNEDEISKFVADSGLHKAIEKNKSLQYKINKFHSSDS